MTRSKYTYFAVAHNDSGASTDVEKSGGGSLRTGSLREIENAARAQLGKGWRVKVWGIQHDGNDGWFPPVEIKTFAITERSAAASSLGRSTSDAKTAAARANGKKGGRPKKTTT